MMPSFTAEVLACPECRMNSECQRHTREQYEHALYTSGPVWTKPVTPAMVIHRTLSEARQMTFSPTSRLMKCPHPGTTVTEIEGYIQCRCPKCGATVRVEPARLKGGLA